MLLSPNLRFERRWIHRKTKTYLCGHRALRTLMFKQKSKANACTIKSFLPVAFFYLLKAAYPFFFNIEQGFRTLMQNFRFVSFKLICFFYLNQHFCSLFISMSYFCVLNFWHILPHLAPLSTPLVFSFLHNLVS